MATYYRTTISKASSSGYNSTAGFIAIQKSVAGSSGVVGKYATLDNVSTHTTLAVRIGPFAALIPSQ